MTQNNCFNKNQAKSKSLAPLVAIFITITDSGNITDFKWKTRVFSRLWRHTAPKLFFGQKLCQNLKFGATSGWSNHHYRDFCTAVFSCRIGNSTNGFLAAFLCSCVPACVRFYHVAIVFPWSSWWILTKLCISLQLNMKKIKFKSGVGAGSSRGHLGVKTSKNFTILACR